MDDIRKQIYDDPEFNSFMLQKPSLTPDHTLCKARTEEARLQVRNRKERRLAMLSYIKWMKIQVEHYKKWRHYHDNKIKAYLKSASNMFL